MTDQTTITPRQPGAQPGNTNALKHGFYARNLGLESPSTIDEKEMRNLLGEAAMLKDFMFKLYSINMESTSSAVLAETLRALSMAGMALSRLMLVHRQVRVYENPAMDELEKSMTATLLSVTAAARDNLHAMRNPYLSDDDE